MAPDSDPPSDFDAVAAAKELDDFLADSAAGDTSELARLEAELQRAKERAQDEIQAAGVRLANASAKELEQRTRKVLESFLPVLDDLDRAVAAARKHVESADVVEGL